MPGSEFRNRRRAGTRGAPCGSGASRTWLRGAIAIATLFTASGAAAQETTQPYVWPHKDDTPGWYDQALLFKAERKTLYEKGYDFHLLYSTETSAGVANVKGIRYAHEIQFGVHLDLEKLAVVKGGKISLVLVNRSGRSLSEDRIGNLFPVQHLTSFQRGSPAGRADLSAELRGR